MSLNVKTAITPENWTIKKSNLIYWTSCSKEDEGAQLGSGVVCANVRGLSSYFKKCEIDINYAINVKDLWYIVDDSGKTYKLIFGKRYSNAKYGIQTVKEIESILRKNELKKEE